MQLILTNQPCPQCEHIALTREIGQSASQGQLRWYVAETCAACDYTIEIDGVDSLEAPYRDEVYARSGIWSLIVDWPSLSAPQFLKVIRLFGLSSGELTHLEAQHSDTLGDYTAFEADYYAKRLAELGVTAQIIQRAAPQTP